jgi:DNA-binding NarL/FixJ family response regulator
MISHRLFGLNWLPVLYGLYDLPVFFFGDCHLTGDKKTPSAERTAEEIIDCFSKVWLTTRRYILQVVAQGKSSSDMGSYFFLSPKTVEMYRSRIMHN